MYIYEFTTKKDFLNIMWMHRDRTDDKTIYIEWDYPNEENAIQRIYTSEAKEIADLDPIPESSLLGLTITGIIRKPSGALHLRLERQ